ncbi:MAG TPA: endonuclease/exonuclease/phosphatase family protein, partial [Pyrinomonadaceae bacterium]|nr:endonuclease/exonuclease/phosphatase family protein [Pyrinomonadaceae bacterium]
ENPAAAPRAACRLLLLLLLSAVCGLTLPPVARVQKVTGAGGIVASTAATDDAHLLEIGSADKSAQPALLPAEIKIVSYNMRFRGGEDLRALVEALRSDAEIGGAAVIGLQEADRHRKRSGNVNTAKLIADELGMHYAWAAPPRAKDDREGEDETGVAILSIYPLADVERIVLPHEGPGGRRRVALGATVRLDKTRSVRVYTIHAETRLAIARKTEQWRAVLDSLHAKHPADARAVVLGDFNTIKGKDVRAARRLFSEANFATPFPDDKSTWKTLFVKLKLDWLWLRGLDATAHGISRHVKFSDHWPLWVKVKV